MSAATQPRHDESTCSEHQQCTWLGHLCGRNRHRRTKHCLATELANEEFVITPPGFTKDEEMFECSRGIEHKSRRIAGAIPKLFTENLTWIVGSPDLTLRDDDASVRKGGGRGMGEEDRVSAERCRLSTVRALTDGSTFSQPAKSFAANEPSNSLAIACCCFY